MDAEVESLIACVAERFTARQCSVEDMNFSSLPGPKIIARNWVYPITKPVSIGVAGQNDIDLGPSHHLSGQQAALSYDYDAKTWWLETKSDEGLFVNGTKWSKGDSGRLLNGAVIKIDEIEMMVVSDGVGISIHRIYVERVGLCPRQVSQTLLLLSFFHARSTQDRHIAFPDRLARHDLAAIQTVWKAVYGLEYAKVEDLGLSRRSRPTDEVKKIIKEERNLITKSPSISSICNIEGKALKAKANLGRRGSTLINASKRRISVRSTPSSVFSLSRYVPTINDMPDTEFKHQELPWVLRERPVREESSGTNLFTEDEDELGSQLECLEKFRTGDGRGFGLRTTAPISADSFVIEYTGRRVPEGSSSSAYQMALGDGWVIDASRGKARLINHSCRPNCCAEKKEIKGRTRIAIRTLKAIRSGEELTFNYRTTTGKKIKCRCSRGCTRNLYIPG